MTDICNFYVGQKVTMIEYGRRPPMVFNGVTIVIPHYGVVYTVRDIFHDSGIDRIGIRLVEIVNPPMQWLDGFKENGWWHGFFRPVTDISELKKLLDEAPIKQLETVR